MYRDSSDLSCGLSSKGVTGGLLVLVQYGRKCSMGLFLGGAVGPASSLWID